MRARSIRLLLLLGVLALAGCGTTTTTSSASPGATRTTAASPSPGGAGPSPTPGPSVYLLGDTGAVFALNPSDGSVRWRTQIPGREIGGMGLGDGSIFVASDSGLYALKTSDGSIRWQVQSVTNLYFLALDQEVVYANANSPNGSSMYAFNASDGTLRWQKQYPGGVILFDVADGFVYLDSMNEGEGQPASPSLLIVLNASDGSVRWRSQRTGSIDLPVVANGVIYFWEEPLDFSANVLYALRETNGGQLWHIRLDSQQNYTGLSVANGTLYTANTSSIAAFSAQNGSLRWRVKGGDINTSLPTPAGTALYVSLTSAATPGSSVWALNASNGAMRWQAQVGNPSLAALRTAPLGIHSGASHPVVLNGAVYVWSDGMVFALNASDGTILWKTGTIASGINGLAAG